MKNVVPIDFAGRSLERSRAITEIKRGGFIDRLVGELDPTDPITASVCYNLYVLRRVAPLRSTEVAPDQLAMVH
jgi:hypothetical protein